MNTIQQPLLDQGVVVCLSVMLIYTKSMEEHQKLATKVFTILKKGLALAVQNSFIYVREVKFLEYIITANGIEISTRKVQAV
jgi:hypothetical protein